jgi:predicted nucleic acid-binding protein
VTELVVDASVVIKWYVREEDSEIAHRILVSPPRLHAPALLRLELANGLRKNWRKTLISIDQAGEAIISIDRTIGTWHDTDGLFGSAFKLSFDLDHALYDCIYLALARQLNAVSITADKQLLSVAPKGLAVALADWKP